MATAAQSSSLTKVQGKNIFYLLNGKLLPLPTTSDAASTSSPNIRVFSTSSQVIPDPPPQFSFSSLRTRGVGNRENEVTLPTNFIAGFGAPVLNASTSVFGFFLGGSSTWRLNGESCFNFESNLVFHLNLSVTPGRRRDKVKLAVNISKCPLNNVDVPKRLKKLVVNLSFHDERDQVLQSNCIQIDPKSSWEELKTTLEDFMPTETLLKVCQFKMRGKPLPSTSKKPQADQNPNEWEFEFVKVTAELDLELELNFEEGPEIADLKLTKCELDTLKYLPSTRVFYAVSKSDPKSSNSVTQSKDKEFVFKLGPVTNTKANEPLSFNFLPENVPMPLVLGTKDPIEALPKSPSQQMSTPAKAKVEKGRNFSQMVTFKVGPTEQIFVAHKDIIMAKSPVFERMLSVDMKEKEKDEIILKEVEPHVLQNFLSLLYSNTNEDFKSQVLNLPAAEILDLVNFSHMYELSQLLKDLTIAFVSIPGEKLTLTVVLGMFIAGCQFEMTDLKFRALQWIKANKSEILNMDGQMEFKDLMAGKDEYLCTLIFELL